MQNIQSLRGWASFCEAVSLRYEAGRGKTSILKPQLERSIRQTQPNEKQQAILRWKAQVVTTIDFAVRNRSGHGVSTGTVRRSPWEATDTHTHTHTGTAQPAP